MVEEILDGVYDITVHEGPRGRYRSYLFDWSTPTLVDTGYPETTDALFAGLDEIGIDPRRVIVTHADHDHIGGLSGVIERYDVETWLPAQSEERVDLTPDHWYADGDAIGRFEAIHMPGHKQDNHALLDEEAGILVTADAVQGSDRRGLPPGYFVLPPGIYSDSLNQAEESLQRLVDREFDVALVFHGSNVLERPREKLRTFVETGLPADRD